MLLVFDGGTGGAALALWVVLGGGGGGALDVAGAAPTPMMMRSAGSVRAPEGVSMERPDAEKGLDAEVRIAETLACMWKCTPLLSWNCAIQVNIMRVEI